MAPPQIPGNITKRIIIHITYILYYLMYIYIYYVYYTLLYYILDLEIIPIHEVAVLNQQPS